MKFIDFIEPSVMVGFSEKKIDIFTLLKKLLEITVLFITDDRFYMN